MRVISPDFIKLINILAGISLQEIANIDWKTYKLSASFCVCEKSTVLKMNIYSVAKCESNYIHMLQTTCFVIKKPATAKEKKIMTNDDNVTLFTFFYGNP